MKHHYIINTFDQKQITTLHTRRLDLAPQVVCRYAYVYTALATVNHCILLGTRYLSSIFFDCLALFIQTLFPPEERVRRQEIVPVSPGLGSSEERAILETTQRSRSSTMSPPAATFWASCTTEDKSIWKYATPKPATFGSKGTRNGGKVAHEKSYEI